MTRLVIVLVAVVALALFVAGKEAAPVDANPPGTVWAPLISCPDVTGDVSVSGQDFFAVLVKFNTQFPNSNPAVPPSPSGGYHPLFDLNGDKSVSGQDFFATLARFNQDCPIVDAEVAKATQATLTIADPPGGAVCPSSAILTENPTCLAEWGYIRGSTDVGGQGVHYVKLAFWDGVFDPRFPEGLVYDNGTIAAQLYYVNADSPGVGWGIEDPGPNQGSCSDSADNGSDGNADAADIDCQPQGPEDPLSPTPGPCDDGINNNSNVGQGGDSFTDAQDPDCMLPGPAPHVDDDVDVDAFCALATCSWTGTEGWHVHFNLCTIHIGQANAAAIPGVASAATCQIYHCAPASPPCGGSYTWDNMVGWMGHLWNHTLNANRLDEGAGYMNGRFADCYPDSATWKAFNCPQ